MTGISYCDLTCNAIVGCDSTLPCAARCWAKRTVKRLAANPSIPANRRAQYVRCAKWDGAVEFFPHAIDRVASRHKPGLVFWNTLGDMFLDAVPIEWIAQCVDAMCSATTNCGKSHKHEEECWCGDHHTHLILTKRPDRMLRVMSSELMTWSGEHMAGDSCLSLQAEVGEWPPPQILLGVTVTNQADADARLPVLAKLAAQGWRTWLSLEPLLESVQLPWLPSFIVVGCESGPNRRPMNAEWARSVVEQLPWLPSFIHAGVDVYIKQLDIDGRVSHDPAEWPEDLRVQERP